ncbi:MAG TPA: DUF6602 domain-containing protein, partial [Candidatus Angelobacter sp.]
MQLRDLSLALHLLRIAGKPTMSADDINSNLPIPDASGWNPRDASESLAAVFEAECNGSEERILQGLRLEKKLAIDNFDSGLPFEGLVRDELKRLLPRRYAVTSGLILDRKGKTGGNCDVIIFDDRWFSPVKSPTSSGSGRPYIPVEGVYAVGEVKQTLSSAELDKAMEKLVKCHRLYRPRTNAHRIVENRESRDCPHGLTNPLFSFVFAGAVAPNETFQSLINRFYDISKQVKRLEVTRALCVLGEGTVTWAFHDPFRRNEVRPALFVKGDLFHPIFPTFSPASLRGALLFLVQTIQVSLFHVVLGPEDLAVAYSFDTSGIKIPDSSK